MVCLVDLTLGNEMFDPYQVHTDDAIEFMAATDDLKTAASNARKRDRLTVTVTQTDGEYTLHTAVEREDETLTATVETLDYDPSSVPSTGDLDYDGTATVALDPFLDAVTYMADSFRLGLDAGRLVLWNDSADRGTVDEFRTGGDHIREIDVANGSMQSLYSRDYLEALTKLQHSVETVELQTGQDYPLKVVAVDDRFDLSFTVAPRIDEDGATGDQLRSIPTVAAGQQTETQAEPDAYAIVDESYENPVETWFRNDAAEHRFDEQAARDRADELDRKHVPVAVYGVTVHRLAGETDE